jgi:hypothetical protein
MVDDIKIESWEDKYAKQKMAYDELAKFVPGQGGLQYFPIPADQYKKWFDAKEKKSMAQYLAREKMKKLTIHEEFKEINENLKAEERIKMKRKGGSLDEFI